MSNGHSVRAVLVVSLALLASGGNVALAQSASPETERRDSALSVQAAGATTATTPGADDAALQQELLQVLQEETEIATRTKLNADYVPGIVSVLHGEELEKLGMRTVWEAMSLVPGVESTINNFGNPLAAVRGIGYDTLT